MLTSGADIHFSGDDFVIFREARDEFLASLSSGERTIFSQCPSAQHLLDEVRQLQIIQKNQSRGEKYLKKIKNLGDALQPYFDVIGITIQSHPDWAAIAWGAFRLVLQLASNFVTFFEKLLDILDNFTEAFPQYDQISHLCGDRSSNRLKNSLRNVYVDIFQFFQSIARVFTKADGRLKRTPAIVGDLFWRPFDTRFQSQLERMKFHRELVNNELILMSCQDVKDENRAAYEGRREQAEERLRQADGRKELKQTRNIAEYIKINLGNEPKDTVFYRFLAWLSPPVFEDSYENSQRTREDGTAYWLFDEDQFKAWQDMTSSCTPGSPSGKFNSNALWIHGNPGCGKTILCASTVKELRSVQHGSSGSTNLVCYFFFKFDSSLMESRHGAYRSILAQMTDFLRKDQAFIDQVTFAMIERSRGQTTASQNVVFELLQLCLQKLRTIFIVLDGVDECSDNSELVQELLQLQACSPSVKILIFSRPNFLSLSRSMPKKQCVAMNRPSVVKDITLFLSRKVDRLIEDDLLPPGADAMSLVTHLVQGADGMFLWARLMMAYLNSVALSKSRRLITIEQITFPEGLKKVYDRILSLIRQSDVAQRTLARRIFTWLLFQARILTTRELHEALVIVDSEGRKGEDNPYGDFDQTIIMTCGGLVERGRCDSGSDFGKPCFRFVHLSVMEYFYELVKKAKTKMRIEESAHLDDLLFTKAAANLDIARTCLLYLTYSLPRQPLSGQLGRNALYEDLRSAFPLASYSSIHWASHLYHGIIKPVNYHVEVIRNCESKINELMISLSQFLSQRLVVMAWIEAFFTSRALWYDVTSKLRAWSEWVVELHDILGGTAVDTGKHYEDIREFSTDLDSLILNWGSKLSENPRCIWDEVTAFNTSRFWAQTSALKVTSLSSDRPNHLESSEQYLCKISEVSPKLDSLGILSIWPSRRFEISWPRLNDFTSPSHLRELCSGWIARYEVWSIMDEAKCAADFRIALDEKEVWMQVCQSLHRNNRHREQMWRIRFPMAICASLKSFTVLRTLFSVDDQSGRLEYQSATLSLDFSSRLRYNWSEERQGFRANLRSNFPGTKVVYHDLYLYALNFSQDGRYLFFRDEEFKEICNFAVFRVYAAGMLRIRLVRVTSPKWSIGRLIQSTRAMHEPAVHPIFDDVDNGLIDFSHGIIRNVVFHPTNPFVILSFCVGVLAWHYVSETAEPRQIYIGEVHTAGFSSCGKYLVIRQVETGYNAPAIKLLPEDLIQSDGSQHAEAVTFPDSIDEQEVSETSNHLSQNSSSISNAGSSTSEISDLGSGGSIQSRLVSVGHARVNVDIAPRQVDHDDVRLRVWAENATATYKLTSLPNWPSILDTSTVVQMPRKTEDMIRIILNKSEKPWYGFGSGRPDYHLPAIIDRDLRSILNRSLLSHLIERDESSRTHKSDCSSIQAGLGEFFEEGGPRRASVVGRKRKRGNNDTLTVNSEIRDAWGQATPTSNLRQLTRVGLQRRGSM